MLEDKSALEKEKGSVNDLAKERLGNIRNSSKFEGYVDTLSGGFQKYGLVKEGEEVDAEGARSFTKARAKTYKKGYDETIGMEVAAVGVKEKRMTELRTSLEKKELVEKDTTEGFDLRKTKDSKVKD
jgi:hypothetical protein